MTESSSHTERLDAALDGKYRIERKLGEGGMASVYLAEDIKHKRKVALKILRPELAAVIGAARFLSEITTTANLQHPHILALFDSGEAAGFLYYVMPFIDGETLRDKLEREQQLGVDEAVSIAREVADALDYAHRHDVIHRDIKPANILLQDGRPMVADFGIALAVSAAGGGRMTETGLSLGTPHYMSPEQASADRDLTARSDVYSLGCVLYEMLAGQPPHTGPSAQNILVRILTEDPRPITELRRTVPPHIASAIAKSIEKLPADRFESAKAFIDALDDHAFAHTPSQPATSPQPSPTGASTTAGATAGDWLADRRSKLAVGAAALATAAAVFFGLRTAGSANDVPIVRTTVAIEDKVILFASLAVSDDGTMLAFIADESPDRIYIRQTDAEGIRALPGTAGANGLDFSPDGVWVVFTEDGSEDVFRIAVAGGPAQRIATVPGNPGDPHWGDDETVVVAASNGIYRFPSQGGEATPILEGELVELRFPRVLPGGRGVLYTERPLAAANGVIRVLDIESGENRVVVDEGNDARYVDPGYLVYALSSGALMAAPFDSRTLETTGAPIPILDSIRVFPGYGQVGFDASSSGVATYIVGGGGGTGGETLVIVSPDGAESPLSITGSVFRRPAVSPDGSKIAFSDVLQGSVYDMTLGTRTLISTSEESSLAPVWSPDGAQIAFARFGADGGSGLYTVPVDGSRPAQPLLEKPGFQIPTAWSPDGSQILFVDFTAGLSDTDLGVLSIGSTDAGTYLEADWNESAADISPNGAWAAYVSDEDGLEDVYVRAFPEPGAMWKVSEGGGLAPHWDPDGTAIYYMDGDNLMAAAVEADAESFEVLSRSRVVTGPYKDEFDVFPDGRFLMIRRATGDDGAEAASRLVVVANWTKELLDRMEGNR